MVGNITFLMIFAVFDPSPLTLWINYSPSRSGNVMVDNITFLMIFAVLDPSPLTLWINCSF